MINEIVQYCHEQYSNNVKNRKTKCENCAQVSCNLNCEKCLKVIHFYGCMRQYDCTNMCYMYMLKNAYKYASEILYLIPIITKNYNLARVNICSIGCGPATELFAFWEAMSESWFKAKEFSYRGFDISDIWKDIQDQILKLTNYNPNITFHNEDVFQYYADNNVTLPNVIILNYMISSMLKYNRDKFDEFLDNLVRFLNGLPEFVLILNDINLGMNKDQARYQYDIILKHLSQSNINIKSYKYHFVDTSKHYYVYHIPQTNNKLHFTIPKNINNNYNPNSECHSAQLVVIKNREQ